jgi:AAA family ATP:ADP antiporter
VGGARLLRLGGVYNLFVVSIFWSFMADLFASERASASSASSRREARWACGGGPFLARTLAVPLGVET